MSHPPRRLVVDLPAALSLLQRARSLGHAEATFTLGALHYRGLVGEVVVNDNSSETCNHSHSHTNECTHTHTHPHTETQTRTHAHTYTHTYIPVDKHAAYIYYNEAAELGSENAWRSLAAMYYLGDGVAKSEETAREIMRVIFHRKILCMECLYLNV